MNRDDDLEPILVPWMARNARPAPDDLMQHVMAEVDAVKQRASRGPAWSSWTWSRQLASVAATGVFAVLVIAIGVALVNMPRLPATGVDPDRAFVEEYLDTLENGTVEDYVAYYAEDAISFGPETAPGAAVGREEIAAAFRAFHAYGTDVALVGEVSHYGPFLTFEITWENGMGLHGTGVNTLMLDADGLITYESTVIAESTE